MSTFVRHLAIAGAAIAMSPLGQAAVNCDGKINSIYKWSNTNQLSIEIKLADGSKTAWIAMPTKSDEALALAAAASRAPVLVYWSATDVSSCINGWAHNRMLEGYLQWRVE